MAGWLQSSLLSLDDNKKIANHPNDVVYSALQKYIRRGNVGMTKICTYALLHPKKKKADAPDAPDESAKKRKKAKSPTPTTVMHRLIEHAAEDIGIGHVDLILQGGVMLKEQDKMDDIDKRNDVVINYAAMLASAPQRCRATTLFTVAGLCMDIAGFEYKPMIDKGHTPLPAGLANYKIVLNDKIKPLEQLDELGESGMRPGIKLDLSEQTRLCRYYLDMFYVGTEQRNIKVMVYASGKLGLGLGKKSSAAVLEDVAVKNIDTALQGKDYGHKDVYTILFEIMIALEPEDANSQCLDQMRRLYQYMVKKKKSGLNLFHVSMAVAATSVTFPPVVVLQESFRYDLKNPVQFDDFVYDKHTKKGRGTDMGLAHFFNVASILAGDIIDTPNLVDVKDIAEYSKKCYLEFEKRFGTSSAKGEYVHDWVITGNARKTKAKRARTTAKPQEVKPQEVKPQEVKPQEVKPPETKPRPGTQEGPKIDEGKLEKLAIPDQIGPYVLTNDRRTGQKRTSGLKPGTWFVKMQDGRWKFVKGPYYDAQQPVHQLFFDSVKEWFGITKLNAEMFEKVVRRGSLINNEFYLVMDAHGIDEYKEPQPYKNDAGNLVGYRLAPLFRTYLNERSDDLQKKEKKSEAQMDEAVMKEFNTLDKGEMLELLKILMLRYVFDVVDTGFHAVLFVEPTRRFVSIDEEGILRRSPQPEDTKERVRIGSKKIKSSMRPAFNAIFDKYRSKLLEILGQWEMIIDQRFDNYVKQFAAVQTRFAQELKAQNEKMQLKEDKWVKKRPEPKDWKPINAASIKQKIQEFRQLLNSPKTTVY